MKTYLSKNIDEDYSAVKESLTARVAPHAATIRESRIVRFFQLACYSGIPNSLTAVIRNFCRTGADRAVYLTPSDSMGLKCPSEVRR